MACLRKRILWGFLFGAVAFSASPSTSYAQGCKFNASTPGKPATCTAVSRTGKCSPVDSGSGSTGICRVLGGEECTCVGSPQKPPPPPPPVPDTLPLTGFVDLHTHPLANLGFGGKLFYGGVDVGALLPADPDCHHNVRATSEQQALGHDNSTHGGLDVIHNICGDALRPPVIHALQSGLGGADPPMDDTSGFPDFPNWPVWNDLTHQKMWVEWIRRSYQGGLRVIVALAVNNKTLGDMTAGPGDYLTDDKTSADLQIGEIKSFVSRHPDFMEVAFTSADVYRIVSANKLAVIIGIEVDHIGNFQTTQNPAVPSDAAVIAEINRLHAEGVRYIFPIHVLDNAFGGSAAYVNLFNVSNVRESGHPYALICADPKDNISYTYNNNDLGFENIVAQMVKTGMAVTSISYPPCTSGQKNALPLTPSGVVAIKEMMRLGMLIDVDHMSQAAADQALALANLFGYPVNSGHNGVRGPGGNERALRADQYLAIGKLHGMAGVGSGGIDAASWLVFYNRIIQAMGGGSIVAGFGTDTNGFALGMPPRIGYGFVQCTADCLCESDLLGAQKAACLNALPRCKASCAEQYPNHTNGAAEGASTVAYTSAFLRSTDGTKTWDYNRDGVAHYGMLPDFLQDVKSLPGGAPVVAGFMTGADYFYRTWKTAEAASVKVK